MGQRLLEQAFVHQLMGIYGTESVRKGVCSSADGNIWNREY